MVGFCFLVVCVSVWREDRGLLQMSPGPAQLRGGGSRPSAAALEVALFKSLWVSLVWDLTTSSPCLTVSAPRVTYSGCGRHCEPAGHARGMCHLQRIQASL